MTYYVEVRPATRRTGPPKLVPLADVGQFRGFRSVFAYPPDVAELIIAQGGTFGLRGVSVHADVILLDFDNCPADATVARLRAEGIGFEHHSSGNRSQHLHVNLNPVTGVWVPAAYKAWAKEYAPTSDLSYMHPAGCFRLPNTWHSRNPGHRKQLLARYEGTSVTLKPPAAAITLHPRIHADEGDAYHRFYVGLTQTVAEGGRRPWVFKQAVLGAEAGLTEAEVLDHMLWWNAQFCVPAHAPHVIAQQVSNAFKYILRKTGNE